MVTAGGRTSEAGVVPERMSKAGVVPERTSKAGVVPERTSKAAGATGRTADPGTATGRTADPGTATGRTVTCGLCGRDFVEDPTQATCQACPLSRACGLVRCPHCGYENPRTPAWIDRVRNWIGR